VDRIELDGRSLTLEAVERVARRRPGSGRPHLRVELAPRALEPMEASRRLVVDRVGSGSVVYGVTTGFGRLAEVAIPKEDQEELQRNLLLSHAAGTGGLLSAPEVRTLLLLRANALARGHSGIRPVVVNRLLEFLNRDLLPAVPEVGSVGASGDLAPLAHVALPLLGEGAFLRPPSGGEAEVSSATEPAASVLERESLPPLRLEAKEGLALINGTQATTGLGILAFRRAARALETLEVAGALSLEALRGTPEAFRPEVHEARSHPGQVESARRLCELLEGSEIRESHRVGDARVQDAYSLRCMPQVHGAGRSVLGYIESVLAREANAATDNPLIFPDAGDEGIVVSAGNFHAQIVSQANDFLCIALADLASVSERRLERLLNPDLSGLPAFLTPKPGLRSGLMILQVTVVDLLAELRVLAHPASVDSVSTSASQEDHVSMGMAAARKARRAVELLETVVAAELLAAAQGIDFLRPLRSSEALERVHDAIRTVVPRLDEDRSPAPDLEAMRRLVASGALLAAAGIDPGSPAG
jgi:histidine ammonia-lyase